MRPATQWDDSMEGKRPDAASYTRAKSMKP